MRAFTKLILLSSRLGWLIIISTLNVLSSAPVGGAGVDGGHGPSAMGGCRPHDVHETFGGQGYFFSWFEPRTELLRLNWNEARKFCKARCWDLAGIETPEENEFIKEQLVIGGVTNAWTSGRKCDFPGCESRPDLQPAEIYGWFWADSGDIMPPTTDRESTDWSPTGGLGVPQPDNRERVQGGGVEESCLAVLNNIHEDGVRWHDMACHHRLRFVCQSQGSVTDTTTTAAPSTTASTSTTTSTMTT